MFTQIVSIEGNIGAGKSTILDYLRTLYGGNNSKVCFVDEPVDMWKEIRDEEGDVLSKFYADPSKYAFAFQVMAFATRVQKLKAAMRENPDARVFVCERSLEADYNIFAKMLSDDGKIESIEYQIYQQFYEAYTSDFMHAGIIYVEVPPETCEDRIKMRGRPGEEHIELSYLQRCHNYHSDWLDADTRDRNMLRIDNSKKNVNIINTYGEAVRKFIENVPGF